MIIEVKNEDTFIPTWNGNDKLSESEQIKVVYRFLLPGEKKKFIHTGPVVLDRETGKLDSKIEFIQDTEGIARAVVKKIENLSISSGGKEKKITSIDALYAEAIPGGLVTEIEMYLLNNASPEIDEAFLAKP